MRPLREEHRVGLNYLEDVTVLLQRIRSAHPTAGLYEGADLQWWWGTPRSTDSLPQLFWFDHLGRPEAAVIATDSGRRKQLDPIVMPDATPDWVADVIDRGLAHASKSGFEAVGLEVDRADDVLREVLVGHGFATEEDGLVETWLAADARPWRAGPPDDVQVPDPPFRFDAQTFRTGDPRSRISVANHTSPPRSSARLGLRRAASTVTNTASPIVSSTRQTAPSG
jgi:hypothetical protein